MTTIDNILATLKYIIDCVIIFVVGVVVFSFMFVFGVIYTTLKHILRFDYSFKKQFVPIFKNIVLIFDGLANAGCGELLNDLLLKKEDGDFHPKSYKYGKWYDTISEVTGVNELRGTLNRRGMFFTRMLSFFLDDGHSVNVINPLRVYPPYEETKKIPASDKVASKQQKSTKGSKK